MDLTAYRAIEANRWRSRLLAGVNSAVLALLFAFAVWIVGPDAMRPVSLLVIFIGSGLFGGRDVVLLLLGARELVPDEEKRFFRRLDVIGVGLGRRALPRVHLVVSPYPNALAIERVGQAGTLVVTNRLLDLDDDELDSVLAHEMFHLSSALVGLRSAMALLRGMVMSLVTTQVLWHRIALAAVVALAVVALGPAAVIFVLFAALYLIAEAWISRQREYLADAQAVLIARHPEALIRALRRMSTADPFAESVAPRANSISGDGERLAASLWTVRPPNMGASWVTRVLDAHPTTEDRIRRLTHMT